MSDIRLTIGLPSYGLQDPKVGDALASLEVALTRAGVEYSKIRVEQCPIFALAMNAIVGLFLKRYETTGVRDRLLFIDNDMVYRADHAMRLVTSHMDCIGANYAMKDEETPHTAVLNGVVEAHAMGVERMGTGLLALSRTLLTKMAERVPWFDFSGTRVPMLFADEVHEGQFYGADVTFFRRLYEAGGSAWVDPIVTAGHIGTKVYTIRKEI